MTITEQDKRLRRIDRNVQFIADTLVTVIAFVFAICVGELIAHPSFWQSLGYSWMAAIAVGVTFFLGSVLGRIMIER
jgi:hypothetical protein